MSGSKETLGSLWVVPCPWWVGLISDLHLIYSILWPSEASGERFRLFVVFSSLFFPNYACYGSLGAFRSKAVFSWGTSISLKVAGATVSPLRSPVLWKSSNPLLGFFSWFDFRLQTPQDLSLQRSPGTPRGRNCCIHTNFRNIYFIL